jgi:hypothetical protein
MFGDSASEQAHDRDLEDRAGGRLAMCLFAASTDGDGNMIPEKGIGLPVSAFGARSNSNGMGLRKEWLPRLQVRERR